MEEKEEEMANNSNKPMQSVLFVLILILCIWIYSVISPLLKNNSNVQQIVKSIDTQSEIKEEIPEPTVFKSYIVKNSNLVVNNYTEGKVFESSGNFLVEMQAGDSGYIITPVDNTGKAISEHYTFLGEGWYNVSTSPASTLLEFPTEQKNGNTTTVNVKTE